MFSLNIVFLKHVARARQRLMPTLKRSFGIRRRLRKSFRICIKHCFP